MESMLGELDGGLARKIGGFRGGSVGGHQRHAGSRNLGVVGQQPGLSRNIEDATQRLGRGYRGIVS
jgi:hypothetical protein